jgi:aromatic-L-amino-acid decarboxylase
MDPGEFRRTGHDIIDRLADYLDTIEERPLFPDISPARLEQLFAEPLPREGMAAADVMAELDAKLFPYCTHVGHPGYFGLITPSPNPVGILGDLIASALNQNPGAWTIGPSAVAMERQTVRWLTDLVGWDERAGGNLTSGGMMANFIGVKLARDAVSGDAAQLRGVKGEWAAYTSEERHVSVDKSVDAVGLGRNALRVLPTDDRFRIRMDALEAAIAADQRNGVRPLCIIAMAGTTNNGAVDDLRALRRIADREGMWLHADAAYGGGMLLSHASRGTLDGIDLADSITIDPHKWFYAPLDAGAILVKEAARLTASFGLAPPYLVDRKDDAGERYNYYVHGFEQSRRFRSLKVWMSFKRYGTAEIGRWIDRNVEQARHLYERVIAGDDFVAACPPVMSALCIRWRAPDLEERMAGPLHVDVARRIEESGRFWMSTTFLDGRTWFRINPVNFRTRTEHIDQLLELLRAECRLAMERTTRAADRGTE